MSKLLILIKGEFQRLNKYNMLLINFIVLLFYLAAAYFIDGKDLEQFIPFIILIDASMMTTLFVGATLFYEKKEHTMNTLIVTPATKDEILLSKIIVSCLNTITTVIGIAIGVWLMKRLQLNIIPLISATIIVATLHTLIGILISYKSKDFTGLLMGYVAYALIFILPTIFIMSGFFNSDLSNYLIILPPEASNILYIATVQNIENWKIIFSLSYLITLSIVLYQFFVKPHFHKYAIKEVGV